MTESTVKVRCGFFLGKAIFMFLFPQKPFCELRDRIEVETL